MEMKSSCCPFYTTLLPGRYFVISTRHGAHKCLEDGDEISVYNEKHRPSKVKVIYYSDDRDFIVFESKVKLCEHMPIVRPVIGGRRYIMLGFADIKQDIKEDEHIKPCFATGTIMSSQPNNIGHICGSSGGVSGFSGGPIFDLVTNDPIGICVSTDDLDDRDTTFGQFSSDMINYCKEITIVQIFPIHDATVILSTISGYPKKPTKRRLKE